MGGSKLEFSVPSGSSQKHDRLINRNFPFQHELHAIYNSTDNKDLATILAELKEQNTSLIYEVVTVLEDTNVVTLTEFQYNVSRDALIVCVEGSIAFEGTDNDYVKTSSTEITFNSILLAGWKVLVILGGTLSSISFGDDLYTSLNKFTQLTDVPSSYHTKAGKYARVNESETGIVFDNAVANTELVKLEYEVTVDKLSSIDRWIPFVNKGIIKGIKVMGSSLFTFSIKTKVNGNWVYYSGDIETILWDIMDIPFIDESGQDSIYATVENKSEDEVTFKIQIYVVL